MQTDDYVKFTTIVLNFFLSKNLERNWIKIFNAYKANKLLHDKKFLLKDIIETKIYKCHK